MKIFKANYSTMCTECFSSLSTGQARATTVIFGASLCAKCVATHTKFDAIKGVKVRVSTLESIA